MAGDPAPPAACAACGRPVDPEVHYLMRVEFVSTPVSPDLPGAGPGTGADIVRLLREIERMSAEELSDSVYCRVEHLVCAACRETLRRHLLLPARLPAELLERLEGSFS